MVFVKYDNNLGNKYAMKKMTQGNWTFVKSNKTLKFKSTSYTYEVDMERDDIDTWKKHLLQTKALVMSSGDIDDMVTLWKNVENSK